MAFLCSKYYGKSSMVRIVLSAIINLALATSASTVFSNTLLHADEKQDKAAATITSIGGKIRKDQVGNVTTIVFVNVLSDKGAESIGFSAFSHLRHVAFYDCEISDRALAQIGKIPKLSGFNLNKSKITDEGFARFLQQQKSLTGILCWQTPFTDKALDKISELESLTDLTLRDVRITDKGLREITKVKKLFALDLTGTDITDIGVAEIAKHKFVTFLCLDETKVSDAGILVLSGMKNLRFLEVRSTKVTSDGVDALQKLAPNLTITR